MQERAGRRASCGEGLAETLAQLTWLSIFSSTRDVLCGRASTRRRIPAPEMKLDSTFSVFNTLFSLSISARALSHRRKARVPVSHLEQGGSPSRVKPRIWRETCGEPESLVRFCCSSERPGSPHSLHQAQLGVSPPLHLPRPPSSSWGLYWVQVLLFGLNSHCSLMAGLLPDPSRTV